MGDTTHGNNVMEIMAWFLLYDLKLSKLPDINLMFDSL